MEFPGLTDLTDHSRPEAAVRTPCLIRELTAHAICVDWRVRLGPGTPSARSLGHLQPPGELLGPPDGAELPARRRHDHYLGRCVWRQGPGFIQIRDRRWGELRRYTVDRAGPGRSGPDATAAPPRSP
ncbi:DUF5825 family protein [Streptomyces sp. NPDC052396]|uniref:DUF5825 family protein n=1 Tax=Streptomyces sp. NPDC052396 TaxID=3365689 RepID=UPI0037D43DDC